MAVIGGGVIGLACALELRGLGAGEVTVLERLPGVGLGSSSRANGGVRAQFATAPNVAFSIFSIDAFEQLEARSGLLGFRQTGYLLVTGTDEGERRVRAARDLQRSLGVPTRWVEPDEIAWIAPFVRADGLHGGTFHDRDGVLDPAGLVTVLERDARAAGARIRTETSVRAIVQDGGGFALASDDGSLHAEVVVNAAGPDARAIAGMLGADVPVEPVRRNLALFLDPRVEPTPMVVDVDTGVLVRGDVAGGWVVGYSRPDDPPGRDTSVDPAFFDDLAERLPNRFGFLADLALDSARCWAGLYPETPDHHAVVGPDPAVPGLVHCIGFGGHGIMHAPAAGRAVAEVVAHGRCDTFDLRPLRPERFDEGDLVVETAVL